MVPVGMYHLQDTVFTQDDNKRYLERPRLQDQMFEPYNFLNLQSSKSESKLFGGNRSGGNHAKPRLRTALYIRKHL